MAVDLYLACRECSCAEHTRLNARHEIAESLCELGWSEALGATARGWLEACPELGLESEPARAILVFAEVHQGHTLGVVGADDLFSWPWRLEREALPSAPEVEAALGAKTKAERELAARLARYRDAPELIEPLLRVLAKDRALSVRGQAALSLASLANSRRLEEAALEPILSALGAALQHPKPAARAAVAEALALLVSGGPGEADVYAAALERREPLREEVARLLGEALEPEDAPRVELLEALGRCARPRSASVILANLRSELAPVQQAATQALRALASAGCLPPEFAEKLLGLAEEALEQDPSFAVQQSWGQILVACGPLGLGALKRLYRTRGWCSFAAQAALCGAAPRPDPLVGSEGRVPRRHPEATPEHLSFLPALAPAPGDSRPESFFELDLAGELVAAQRADGLSVIWNLHQGRIVRELWHESDPSQRRRDPARLIALSPTGQTLATGTTKGQVRVWSVAEGTLLGELEAGSCSRLRFGPGGALLYVGTPAGVAAWDVASGEPERRYPIQHAGDVVAARLDPSGERVATCGRTAQRRADPEVHVLSRSGAHLLTLVHETGALDLAWSPCGTKLAVLCSKQLVVWSAEGQRLEARSTLLGKRVAWPEPEAIVVSGAGARLAVQRGSVRTEEGVRGAAFAAEGVGPTRRWLCGGSGGEATLEVPGQAPRELETGGAGPVAVATGGGLAATLVREGKSGKGSLLRWWGQEEAPGEARLPDPTGYLVAISPGGTRLAAMTQRWLICVEAATGAELWRREGKFYELGSLEFSPEGGRLLVPSKEDSLSRRPGWVEVLDAASGVALDRLGGVSDPGAFQLSSDGRHLATGGAWPTPRGQDSLAGPSLVWDLGSGELRHSLRDADPLAGVAAREPRPVLTASLAPGGRLLASGGRDGVLLWDLEEERLRWRAALPPAAGAASGSSFDASGERLAVGTSQDQVFVFEVASGRELLRLSRAEAPRAYPPAIAPRFLPDGRLVWGRLQLEVFDLPAALAEEVQRRPALRALPSPSPSSSPEAWLELAGDVSGLAVGESCLIAASGQGDLVCVSRAGERRERWRQRPFPHGVRSLALSPSGTVLVCAGWGGELEVFDVESGQRRQELQRASTWVLELGFHGEGQAWGVVDPGLAGPWSTSQVLLWDVATGRLELGTSGTCATSALGRLVTGALEARFNAPLASEAPREVQEAKRNRVPAPLALFKGRSLRWRRLVSLPPQASPPSLPPVGPGSSRGGQRALAFSPDGETLAVARDGPGLAELVLLQVGPEEDAVLASFEVGPLDLLAWREDGRALAYAARGGQAFLLDLALRDPAPLASGVTSVTALAWAGEQLLVGTERGVVWSWR